MNSENKIGEAAEGRRASFELTRLASRLKMRVRFRTMVTAISAGAMFAWAPSVRAQGSVADAVTPCVSPIASCGCTITTSGFYKLANGLSSSQGLTANNGCIDITASNVVLNTGKPVTSGVTHGGFDIEGPGGGTPTGIGIHILKGSNGDFLEFPGKVEGWDVGLLLESNSNIVDFDFRQPLVPNGTAGIEINGGNNNNVNNFSANHNNNYGVWLRGASNNQVNCSDSDNNGNIGVYIGCSDNGPINAKCSPSVPPSNNNRIFDHSSEGNGKYGVVIDLGNTGNIVTDVRAESNGTMDMLDENKNCDHNRWFFDGFNTASPGCIGN
jgi:Right handed beta helix region